MFPRPGGGGEMKIRFGITAPLTLEDRSSGLLRLPHFLDRNFGVPDDSAHAIWIEAKNPLRMQGGKLLEEHPRAGLYAVRGELKDAELSASAAVLRTIRSVEVTEAWTRDPLRKMGASSARSSAKTKQIRLPISLWFSTHRSASGAGCRRSPPR
jgi:hypothetical protein